jgi:hypothetical protein
MRVIEHEDVRRKERLKGHYENDVWSKRKTPPSDWNKPLPNYISKRYENSYLDIKNKEMKGEVHEDVSLKEPTYCSLM